MIYNFHSSCTLQSCHSFQKVLNSSSSYHNAIILILIKKVKVKVKERIVLREIHLRTTGCHLSMGSHSVICHPTEVTAPASPQPGRLGWRRRLGGRLIHCTLYVAHIVSLNLYFISPKWIFVTYLSVMWLWFSTSSSLKLTISSSCPLDQSASKLVNSFSKYHVHKFGNEWTNGTVWYRKQR